MLEAQIDLLQRPLELGQRARLVHAGVDQHDPGPGGDRPRVAVRHARPRQRQPQPPQPGQDALATSQLAWSVIVGGPYCAAAVALVTVRVDCARRWPPRPTSPSATSARSPRTISTRAVACWAAGRDRPLRRPAGADRARRRPRSTSGRCSPPSRTSRFEVARADHLPRPHRGALAGAGDLRRARALPGLRAQRRPRRPRGLRRADRHRRPDQPQRRLRRQRRHRPPARVPAAGRLAGRGAADAARQPAHPAAQADPRRRRRADRRRRLDRPRRLPAQDDERLPDRGRGRGDRVRRRDLGHGHAACAPPARGSAAIQRVVLGHADSDHRGAAPALGAPVYCHPAEREAAESPDARCATTGTSIELARTAACCSGGCSRPGTAARWRSPGPCSEGDEIAGFQVVELPGHAPGLIGLFRESDRLALVSDCFYTLDPQTGLQGRRARAAPRLQPRHRAGPRLDPQARRARAQRRPGPVTPIRSPATSRPARARRRGAV